MICNYPNTLQTDTNSQISFNASIIFARYTSCKITTYCLMASIFVNSKSSQVKIMQFEITEY